MTHCNIVDGMVELKMKQLGMLPTPATGSATGGSSAGGTAR
jgi:hypothetical protein